MTIQIGNIRRLLVLLLTIVLASGTLASIAAPAEARLLSEKTSTFYLVQAHPDDEAVGWQLIDDHQDAYTVLITLTLGELSKACVTAEEAITFATKEDGTQGPLVDGPYRYEGPNSPVGQKDEGERMPFVNPWQGRGHENCGKAKLASWHWFLDDVANLDPGFPDFGISDSPTRDPWLDDDYQGNFCPMSDDHPSPDHTVHPGNDPKGKHTSPPLWDPSLGCIDVWADGKGARVAFDLGDGGDADKVSDDPITEADVIAAVEAVRANRGSWGIQVLPESGLMATAPGCDPIGEGKRAHRDHEAIQNALYEHDFGAGPQYGIVCDENTYYIGDWINQQKPIGEQSPDRRYLESPGEQQPSDAAEWALLNYGHPVTTVAEPATSPVPAVQKAVNPAVNSVQGPIRLNYGWITDEFNGAYDFPLRTTWKRFDDIPQEAVRKGDMFYVLAAHPDDEPNIWSFIESLDESTYVVFVNFTRGEGTASCMTAEDAENGGHLTEEATFVEGFEAAFMGEKAWGPYKYQGPGSPVADKEPNHGETDPYGEPWVGQGSEECKKARVASWHWFMDEMHELDGTGTTFEIGDGEDPWADDDYQGEFCDTPVGCAQVWADEQGARVSFDLGNTNSIPPVPGGDWTFGEAMFGTDDVVTAIDTLRSSRSGWGIAELPEAGMVSGSGYEDDPNCGPFRDPNPDHLAVQEAVMTHDFDAGPQYQGMVCPIDQTYGTAAEVHEMRPDILLKSQLVSPTLDETRIGPFNRHYGWLFSTYVYFKSAETYLKAFD